MLRITCHIYSYMSHITERKKGVFPNLDVQFGLKPKLNLQVPVYKIVRKIALIAKLWGKCNKNTENAYQALREQEKT